MQVHFAKTPVKQMFYKNILHYFKWLSNITGIISLINVISEKLKEKGRYYFSWLERMAVNAVGTHLLNFFAEESKCTALHRNWQGLQMN